MGLGLFEMGLDTSNQWLTFLVVAVLGLAVRRLEKRLDTLEDLRLEMVEVKANLKTIKSILGINGK